MHAVTNLKACYLCKRAKLTDTCKYRQDSFCLTAALSCAAQAGQWNLALALQRTSEHLEAVSGKRWTPRPVMLLQCLRPKPSYRSRRYEGQRGPTALSATINCCEIGEQWRTAVSLLSILTAAVPCCQLFDLLMSCYVWAGTYGLCRYSTCCLVDLAPRVVDGVHTSS